MAESPDLAKMQQQLDKMQEALNKVENEENIPKWWDKQKCDMEARFRGLESRMDATQNSLDKLVGLLTRKMEEMSPGSVTPPPKATDHSPGPSQTTKTEKGPTLITVLNGQEKYSYKPNEPGILQNKPKESTFIRKPHQ
ncbi:hypothetical protein HRI_004056900 [Hibiscus trionum]|uniref:Uncharacterized protein n=1 Tax=Hibiscus trionum TaxID=183268 RepID=A0A9W7IWZ9_HIBTR|nr:hypothetical protein HRI_004056900 [Hibiscus trionum]